MKKEEIRERMFQGGSASVELPSDQWMYLVAILDRVCENSLKDMRGWREQGIKFSDLDQRKMQMMSVPFLTRAFMADDLKGKGVLPDEQLEEKGLEWVESIFQQMDDGLPN